jgi:hypothetical protein
MLFRGQASWAKMTSPGVKLKVLACQMTLKINKAEQLTYLSTNFGCTIQEGKTLLLTVIRVGHLIII